MSGCYTSFISASIKTRARRCRHALVRLSEWRLLQFRALGGVGLAVALDEEGAVAGRRAVDYISLVRVEFGSVVQIESYAVLTAEHIAVSGSSYSHVRTLQAVGIGENNRIRITYGK